MESMQSESVFDQDGVAYLSTLLDAVAYGVHMSIFGFFIGLHYYQRKKIFSGFPNIAGTILFVFCTFVLMIDIWESYYVLFTPETAEKWEPLGSTSTALFAVIDFTAQMTLIHRCWIIWSNNNYVVLLPTFIALATLGCEFAVIALPIALPIEKISLQAFEGLGRFTFAGSLVTNALITFLTVYYIWKMSTEFEKVNPGASKPYRLIIAILLESGFTLFIAQLLLVVLWSTGSNGFPIVGGVITQLYGVTPTIILCRALLGTSYEPSRLDVTSIQFAAAIQTSTIMPSSSGASDGGRSDALGEKPHNGPGEPFV